MVTQCDRTFRVWVSRSITRWRSMVSSWCLVERRMASSVREGAGRGVLNQASGIPAVSISVQRHQLLFGARRPRAALVYVPIGLDRLPVLGLGPVLELGWV
jgi:hypothetical protein